MDGEETAGWQRRERRKIGTQAILTVQVGVEFANWPGFMATNADLFNDPHLAQVDEEQATLSRMNDGVFFAEESDGFSGWIVLGAT